MYVVDLLQGGGIRLLFLLLKRSREHTVFLGHADVFCCIVYKEKSTCVRSMQFDNGMSINSSNSKASHHQPPPRFVVYIFISFFSIYIISVGTEKSRGCTDATKKQGNNKN